MLHDFRTTTVASVENDIRTAIAAADAIIDTVSAVEEPRTFDNTMLPLERASTIVGDAYGRSGFMARVHTDEAVRRKAVEMEEVLSKWGTELIFRRDLYEAVAEYAATEEAGALTADRARLVDHWMRDFRRAGHHLDDGDRAELQRLQTRLVELQVPFGQNLDEWDDHIEMTREDLDGMPEDYIERLAPGASPGTYKVTMEYPDYVPFMQQSPRRDLRQALQFKYWNRAAELNRPLLEEAVEIRANVAKVLGYDSWAHYAMEVKMAEVPDAVHELYGSVVPGLEKKAAAERMELQELLDADHPGAELQPWDWTYYVNELKKRDYGVDPNEVAAYFPLEQTVQGMFEITGEVFGLTYTTVEDTQAWHPDVYLYEIRERDTGELIAYFYADLFPREGKYGHAAAFPLVYGRRNDDGTYQIPVSAIVANFTKPTAEAPSLLKHDEALTLFHEFGHILHFSLTTVELPRFSGYDTEWDFVEAPSQIMEHWMWRPEVLQRFATHHQTGEPIPEDLVERLVAARDMAIGMSTLRQIFLGKTDLDLHDATLQKDLDKITRDAYAFTGLPYHEGTFFLASFGHLMGGYDAGYYGYLWAKVYGDDMFSVFDTEGVTNPDVGRRYREEILAQGGARDAMVHLRAFLGREPSSDAFLSHLGLK